MAGCSLTPLPKKLGIREGSRVGLVAPPPDFTTTIGEFPPGAAIAQPGGGTCDVIVCFVTELAEVESRFLELKPRLAMNGGLWIAWPKRRKGFEPQVSENQVRDLGLAAGLVDNKVCAIDDTWSALRFVYRVKDR